MGFYAPFQPLQNARRHAVEIRPADVTASYWDCTLEAAGADPPALRPGLRLVKNLLVRAAKRLDAACEDGSFRDISDMVQRTLIRREFNSLVAA